MATEAAAKPLPEPTRDSKPYWDGLNEGTCHARPDRWLACARHGR